MKREVKPPRMMYTKWGLVTERWPHAIAAIVERKKAGAPTEGKRAGERFGQAKRQRTGKLESEL